MPTLTVGPSGEFQTLSAAIAASQDGDLIQVQAGTYTNDFAVINTKITIEGVGGAVNLVATEQPPNGKAILVTNTDITLSNLEFSGVTVPDGNGAGVRYQSGNLTINDCIFHDNQDGLLSNADTAGSITINNSEFIHNGAGDGFTHNLYVGEVGTLTVTDSYFNDAVVGHEIKSRALNTIIQGSTIVDGPTGSASYAIDLPNGGNNTIRNNFIEKGPLSENPAIIHFGGEGTPYPGSSLAISDNTILNDLISPSSFAVLNQISAPVNFTDNQVFGLTAAQISNDPVVESATDFLTVEPLTPCFASGTRIATEWGEIPVEQLQVGDRVLTRLCPSSQPIIWIGRRRVVCRDHVKPQLLWPLRIAAEAFGPAQPCRDLWLSPEHAIFLSGVLIPARLLINHTTITQVPVNEVTYHHIELARHDVILAEELPVESYLDTGNRDAFDSGRIISLHPDFALRQWDAQGCAPLIVAGPLLIAARLRINALAAARSWHPLQSGVQRGAFSNSP